MTLLAACRRASVLALAVVCEGTIVDICRFRLEGPARSERIAGLIRKTAADYNVTTIVAEPQSIVGEALTMAGMPFLPTTVGEAKQQLLASNNLRHEFYARLLDDHPQLRVYLRLGADSCRSLLSDRSRTAPLLAVAFGLGAAQVAIAAQVGANCLLN